jgi:uncharacterized protein (TIGR00369 family)
MSRDAFDALLNGWTANIDPQPEGGALPAHHSQCLGCGSENPHGHHLLVVRESENSVTADHTFDSRHVGAPGIAHGGAVATVFDDLYGFLLYSIGKLAVTRKLEVEYLRPVRLDVQYTLRAVSSDPDGRKIHMTATLEDGTGDALARSDALFVIVDIEHFKSQGQLNREP